MLCNVLLTSRFIIYKEFTCQPLTNIVHASTFNVSMCASHKQNTIRTFKDSSHRSDFPRRIHGIFFGLELHDDVGRPPVSGTHSHIVHDTVTIVMWVCRGAVYGHHL